MLGRLGLRHINACDGDVFSVSNLNRQLLATEDNLGTNKAKAAAIRMETVNSEVSVRTFAEYLTPENAARIFDGCDLVIDALDSPQAKCMLEELCEGFRLPLVHGAVEGWFGQVCTVMPGDWTLRSLYQNTNRGDQQEAEKTGNPSFTPAAVAALQVSEALKVLLDKEGILRNEVLFLDLYCGEFQKIKMKKEDMGKAQGSVVSLPERRNHGACEISDSSHHLE